MVVILGDLFALLDGEDAEHEYKGTDSFLYVKRLTRKQARAVQQFVFWNKREFSDDSCEDSDTNNYTDTDTECSEEAFQ